MNNNSGSLLVRPTLCFVTNFNDLTERDLLSLIQDAVDGGVNMVQIREKDLSSQHLLPTALAIKEIVKDKALLIVNKHVDLALACGADGIQLGEEAISVVSARKLTEIKLLIGRSVHSVGSAQEAERQGADFLIVGTIFSTPSKLDIIPKGLNLLEEVASAVKIPFLGIGGIDKHNAAKVVGQGAAGVAVIRSILGATDRREAAREIKEEVSRSFFGRGNFARNR
jgi:thiamine-phosphate pyrophosphorylase